MTSETRDDLGCCGGNDDSPPIHTSDCSRRTTPCSSCDGRGGFSAHGKPSGKVVRACMDCDGFGRVVGESCGARTDCVVGGIDVCALPAGHSGEHRSHRAERVCSWPNAPGWEPREAPDGR